MFPISMKILTIILISSILFLEVRNSDQSFLERKYGKLSHVSVIFRHGERAPYATYPLDPHKTHSWPNGLGQLLRTGKFHSYNLGKWFRQQYKKLLDSVGSHTRMTVESSDMDRTIMSAQYFMAGFYPPNKAQRISKNLRWQPIPVHTSTITEENYIWVNVPCPKSDNLTEKFFRSTKMKKTFNKNIKIFNYLQKHTGHTFSRDMIAKDVWKLYEVLDILDIEREQNLTLPSWTKKVYPKRLMKLLDLFLYKEFSQEQILQLIAGPMLKSITADLVSNSNTTNNATKKFHFYSGHDNSISSVMYALGNYNGINPTYCASLIFELRRKANKNFVIVQYKNSSQPIPHLLKIPRCGNPCTIQKFVRTTSPLFVTNWKEECKQEEHHHNHT